MDNHCHLEIAMPRETMKTSAKKLKQPELKLSAEVIDESEKDDTTPALRYEITS